MRIRTQVNCVLLGVLLLITGLVLGLQVRQMRQALAEKMEASTHITAQILSRVAQQSETVLPSFLDQLGRVRAQSIRLLSAAGELRYQSPKAKYLAESQAPLWFQELVVPVVARDSIALASGERIEIEADVSRSLVELWQQWVQLLYLAALCVLLTLALSWWLLGRILRPLPIIANGLKAVGQGDFQTRLPHFAASDTQQIAQAFNQMSVALAQARETQAQLAQSQDIAEIVAQHIEAERRAISRELHDEFSQSVTAIQTFAQLIVQSPSPPDVKTPAALIATEAKKLYAGMQNLIPRLSPFNLGEVGLDEALFGLIQQWRSQAPGLVFSLSTVPIDLGERGKTTLYRAAQEGLLNAVRHAAASQIDLLLTCQNQQIQLEVKDNGQGLAVGLDPWQVSGHFGLRALRERVGLLGGTCEFCSAPVGSSLTVKLPHD
jgi:two-component system, NarL family, sensor histidine kinase UhpB